ncbi:hypothetical protein [Lutibacter sp.]|uniref:hypothetical protein n=1 Tax=Lutibacter sp. TaxID=1925666 RepID=UPI0034A03A25
MKKIAILILISITSLSCNNTNKKIDYGNILNNCFSENEIAILNETCTQFESNLSELYPKEPIGIKYKLYLKDISELNEPTGFVKNSPNNLLDKLKNSSVFDKIWTKYSAAYYEDDSYEIQAKTNLENTEIDTAEIPKDFYITNPKGAYVDCLLKNQKNIFIEEYLLAVRDIGEISPQILAQGLLESMTESDYDDKPVRLIIAINLFYEQEFNTSE